MKDIFGVKVVKSTKDYFVSNELRLFKYVIRHADFKPNVKATIEKFANVNFHSTIFTDKPIEWIEEDPKNNYIQIHEREIFTKERNLVIV